MVFFEITTPRKKITFQAKRQNVKTLKATLAIAYIAILLIMAVATIFEKIQGYTEIYATWWFASIWALLAIVGLAYIMRQKLFKKPAAFAMHISFLLILAGALITHLWGEQSSIHIRVGEINSQLPFLVKLDSFKVVNYPGTQSPMDFASQVMFIDNNGNKTTAKISMNKIAEHHGYRFYQSAYDYDAMGTTLAVSHDPWGIGFSYLGYFFLFISMLLMLVLPNEGFRKAIKTLTKNVAIIAILLCSTNAMAQPSVLPKDAASQMCNVHAYYNGRVCPLQTIAKDFTVKLYGKSTYKGFTAEQVFTGWYFFPSTWTSEPMIKVKNAEKRYYTFNELAKRNNSQVDDEKINIVRMLLNGQMLNIFPYEYQNSLVWLNQGDNLPLDMPEDQWFFIKKTLDYLGEQAVTKDFNKFSQTVDKIIKYQEKTAVGTLPSKIRFRAEKLYNKLDFTRPLAMGLATLGIVTFVVFAIWWAKGTLAPKWLVTILNILVASVLLYMIAVVGLRGFVANHLPITNGYETMQFMALTALVLTLIMQQKFALTFPFGLLLSGLTLMVSMFGESNPQITHLMPVLASPLLSIHVCVIMIAYSLFAFMMFNGATALIMEANNKSEQSQNLYYVSRMLLYPALLLLTAGIFIGAIWANQSWGRYWGWDPKEVWALISMLVYAIPMHASIAPALQRPKAFHIFAVIAFLTVLMTYFGVNFILGGMHSYANS